MDYTTEALQEMIDQLEIIKEAELQQMVNESLFLQKCYETYSIPTMEATKADLSQDLIFAVQRFLERITSFFRKSSISKYTAMFNDDSIAKIRENLNGSIKESCNKLQPKQIAPYWKADYNKDGSELMTAIRQAINNINHGKVDYTFASRFVKDTEMVQDQDTRLAAYLKNYFRFGDNDMTNPERVTVTGSEIFNLLDDILAFVQIYPTTIAAFPGKISDFYRNQSKTIKMPGATTAVGTAPDNPANDGAGADNKEEAKESFTITPDTYLSVEERYVYETLLPLFMGYPVTEAEAKANDKPSEAEKNKQKEQAKDMNKDEQGNSLTGVKSEDDDKPTTAGADKAEGGTDKEKEDAKTQELKEYLKDVNNFFQLAVAAYQTALEERFVTYGSILKMVASQYMKVPSNRKKTAEQDLKQAQEDKKKAAKAVKAAKKKKKKEKR